MKPTIAAARLRDGVRRFRFRPGRIKHEFAVNPPRPRQIEDLAATRTARGIREELHEKINKSRKNDRSLVVNAKSGPIAIRLRSGDDESRQPWIVGLFWKR